MYLIFGPIGADWAFLPLAKSGDRVSTGRSLEGHDAAFGLLPSTSAPSEDEVHDPQGDPESHCRRDRLHRRGCRCEPERVSFMIRGQAVRASRARSSTSRGQDSMVRKRRWLGLALALLAGVIVGCGSADSETTTGEQGGSSDSSTQTDSGGGDDSTQGSSTQYAVVFKITPFGDICKPAGLEGVAKELQTMVRDAGLTGKIVGSEDYAGQRSGGSCVEYGRYTSRAEAQTALDETQGKLEDPQLAGSDGYPAKIVEVVGAGD